MTEQLYRADAYQRDCTARVLSVNERGGIVLDRTVFYAAGGGQPGDSGLLELDSGGTCPIATAVYDTDKTGIVQCTIGRASFTPEQLRDNLGALLDALNKSKPASTKGIFLRKVSVSSTMGLGVKVDPSSLAAQA